MIWNLIFALSLGYAVCQALPAQRQKPSPLRVFSILPFTLDASMS